VLRVE